MKSFLQANTDVRCRSRIFIDSCSLLRRRPKLEQRPRNVQPMSTKLVVPFAPHKQSFRRRFLQNGRLQLFTDNTRKIYIKFLVQCMIETWYSANDMQFFLISPFIIYPIWRWKTAGLVSLAVLTLASLASNIIIFATNDIPMFFSLLMYFNRT